MVNHEVYMPREVIVLDLRLCSRAVFSMVSNYLFEK